MRKVGGEGEKEKVGDKEMGIGLEEKRKDVRGLVGKEGVKGSRKLKIGGMMRES